MRFSSSEIADVGRPVPFSHQVAGHTQLLDSGPHVHKTTIPRELSLYLTLSKQNEKLHSFLPQFYGISMRNEEDVMTLVHSPENLSEALVGDESDEENDDDDNNNNNDDDDGGSSEVDGRAAKQNQSSHRTTEHLLSRLRKFASIGRDQVEEESMPNRFVVLENLTWGMHRPCVMDIKLGVRQHTDDEPEDKRIRKQGKCDATTSKTLGMRICGYKVWSQEDQDYCVFDKHHGRSLTESTVIHALRRYFSALRGHALISILRHFVHTLSALISILEQESRFLFYSSSLLLVYDANASPQYPEKRASIRLIDYAHTVDASPAHPAPVNQGVLFGCSSLMSFLSELLAEAAGEAADSTTTS